MGQKDMVLNEYFKKNEIFADAVNGIIFHGEQVVAPDDLEELDSSYSLPRFGKWIKRDRDVIKKVICSKQHEPNALCVMIGVENQLTTDYTTPIRVMNYDVAAYTRQIEAISQSNRESKSLQVGAEYLCGLRKADRLIPVITIIIDYDKNGWDGPASLHEMLAFGESQIEALKPYVSNYHCNIFHANAVEHPNEFKSELKAFFTILAYLNDKNKLKQFIEEHPEDLIAGEDTIEALAELTGNKGLYHIKKYESSEGGIAMYDALDELLEERKSEGWQEGERTAKVSTAKNLLDILEPDIIAEKVGLPLEEVMYLREQAQYKADSKPKEE